MKICFHLFAFIILVQLLNINPAFSQQITFNKVILPIGNSAGFVGGIAQDKNGYMWFATAGGLYKYDGYRFKIYTNNASDTNSLSATHLESVYIDREGVIWIATWTNGLDRLDPQTGKFMHFSHDPDDPGSLSHNQVRAMIEDHEGVLWVGTLGGLDKYDRKTGKFQHYRHDANDPRSLSSNIVRALYEDRAGTLWVGTGSVYPGEDAGTDDGGLNRFDRHTGKFTQYRHKVNDPRSLVNNKVLAIFEDSKGIFWVGTAGDGLHTMDRKTGTFERHQYDPHWPGKLSRPPIDKSFAIFDHITFISEDAFQNIWIGTLLSGINKYDLKTQSITHYGLKDSAAGLAASTTRCSYNSADGVLWIGTNTEGLYRSDPYHKNIAHIFIPAGVTAFNIDTADNFWMGTPQGLIFQDRHKRISKTFLHENGNKTSLSDNAISAMYRDNEGILWIGTANGLNRFNERSKNFTRYLNDPKNNTKIGTVNYVNNIEHATGDSLWLATDDGLILMDKHTGALSHFRNNSKGTYSLSKDIFFSLLGEKSGNLWVGTYSGGGLNYLDHTTKTFTHFLDGISAVSILRASSGKMWVGTEIGLYETNDINSGFRKFNYTAGGIDLTNILSIQEDKQKNIWVSSTSGIFRIDPGLNETTVYGTDYGVNADKLNLAAGYKGPRGEIFFGDLNGYYVFSPDEFIRNPTPPQIILTNFSIAGKPVVPGEKGVLTSTLENAKEISLKFDQNIFSFDFVGIHYSDPKNNHHLYMLENYDQSWHEAGMEKSASYFNVPPGHYIFHVKVSSADGIWAEKSISIFITPPWWRTWWAYCAYGLIFILLVYAVHRYQKARVIKTERERSRIKELAQAKEIEEAYYKLEEAHEILKTTQSQLIHQEKMASLGELTAGIAHEIQNPLNFVNNFSEINKEMIAELKEEINKGNYEEVKTIANDIEVNEEKINHHGKRADAIVKGMLQHSKTSSGVKEPIDINKLTDEYLRLSYHGMRAKDKSFEVKIMTDFDESIGKINIVSQDIGRVLLNLFNNAFYAVNEKSKQTANELTGSSNVSGQQAYVPTVTVVTKNTGDKVEIRVEDNGNGIPRNIVDKIFQPFFTTKPTGQGTGLGLSLAYDIIKAHGGEIKVEIMEGGGSGFIVQLPTA